MLYEPQVRAGSRRDLPREPRRIGVATPFARRVAARSQAQVAPAAAPTTAPRDPDPPPYDRPRPRPTHGTPKPAQPAFDPDAVVKSVSKWFEQPLTAPITLPKPPLVSPAQPHHPKLRCIPRLAHRLRVPDHWPPRQMVRAQGRSLHHSQRRADAPRMAPRHQTSRCLSNAAWRRSLRGLNYWVLDHRLRWLECPIDKVHDRGLAALLAAQSTALPAGSAAAPHPPLEPPRRAVNAVHSFPPTPPHTIATAAGGAHRAHLPSKRPPPPSPAPSANGDASTSALDQ